MAENSKIGWCDHTWNPWIGCTKVSAGCKNCYAERDNKHRQWNKAGWGKGVPRHRTSEANWKKPYHWDKLAKENGVRYKVFCASLADVFDTEVDIDWLYDLLKVIQDCRNLDWLLLTKRIEEVDDRISEATGFSDSGMWFYTEPHVWIGTTTENQEQANIRIPELLKIPAKMRFLSCEPLLGPIDLRQLIKVEKYIAGGRDDLPLTSGYETKDIHWVIAGGESGVNNRPMHNGWAKLLRDQCAKVEIPFFMKQMSGNTKALREAIPEDLHIQEFPK